MRFKGVSQIVLFNWPFFAFALFLGGLALLIKPALPHGLESFVEMALYLGSLSVILSLLASWFVYDLSDLYAFDYLPADTPERIANLHAGFDETTSALKVKYPGALIDIYDFYDPEKHTEASIRRARARYPAIAETVAIDTSHIPIGEHTYDALFLIFSAHEIRDQRERIAFFKELRLVAKPTAKLYVIEHLRDWKNALVYSIGCLHFHSEPTWQKTFAASGWQVVERKSPNAFVVCYTLQWKST
jgi:hypothetical protein